MAAAYIGLKYYNEWQEGMLPTSFQNMVWCFFVLGMYFKGFSKGAIPYWIFFVIIGS
jgi:hypothetical protein